MEPGTAAVHIDFDEDAPTATETAGPTTVFSDGDIPDEDAEFDPADRLPRHAIRQKDGSVVLPLRYPTSFRTRKGSEIKETKVDHLVLHRLTGADQMAIFSTSDEMKVPVALARSTRMMQARMSALFAKMDAADTSAASQVINHFFASGRPIGRRGSDS